MNDEQLLRYSRHILLDEIGIEVQQRLLATSVLVIGAGGLGSAAALYLAAAGVGRLVIADGDRVDPSNLQRQIVHPTSRIGQAKASSACATLAELNPGIEIVAIDERLENAALERLIADAQVVLDCTDAFETRHAINRACVSHRTPLVSGAAIRFDAQITVFDVRDPDSPCYACLFAPNAAHEEIACAVMGVFAPLTGIIGTMQAAEALKLAGGFGTSLVGRLQMLDARSMHWSEMRIGRDPDCMVCAARDATP